MYTCECFKCHQRFLANSKRAGICPECKIAAAINFDVNEHKMVDRVTGEPRGFPQKI